MADFEKVIPPGQEGKIDVKITGGKLFPGMFEKNFTVSTNDPENKQFTLTIQGTVKKVFELSRQLSWNGYTGEELKIDAIITNLLSTPINVKNARWDDDARNRPFRDKLAIKLETVESGKKYHIKVWSKGDLPSGAATAIIVLDTDYPKMPQKTIPLTLNVRNDVEVQPPSIFFGEMVIPPGATKPFERSFTITAQRSDTLKILKAVPSREDISVKIEEVQPGRSFRGTVWVRPADRMGQYTGVIRITTNYPRCKELVVELRGTVRVGDAVEGLSPGKK